MNPPQTEGTEGRGTAWVFTRDLPNFIAIRPVGLECPEELRTRLEDEEAMWWMPTSEQTKEYVHQARNSRESVPPASIFRCSPEEIKVTCTIRENSVISFPASCTCSGRLGTWINLGIKYADISQAAVLVVRVEGPQPGQRLEGEMPFFGQEVGDASTSPMRYLRTGVQRIAFEDVSLEMCACSSAKNENINHNDYNRSGRNSSLRREIEQLDESFRRYEDNLLPHVGWLDNLALPEVDRRRRGKIPCVVLELSRFDLPVRGFPIDWNIVRSAAMKERKEFVLVEDREMQRSNPSEEKYKTLSVSRIIDDDPTLKPSRAEKDRLAEILQLPPTAVLRKEDIALVWQFRYFLSEDPNSLSKFLRAVQWEHVSMRAQALDVLRHWETPTISAAMEILSDSNGGSIYPNSARLLALSAFDSLSTSEFLPLLLPLVHALRHEDHQKLRSSLTSSMQTPTRSQNESMLGDTASGPKAGDPHARPLFSYLLSRSLQSLEISNHMFWLLKVEGLRPDGSKLYDKLFSWFCVKLSRSSEHTKQWMRTFDRQKEIVDELTAIGRDIYHMSAKIEERNAVLHRRLAALERFDPMPFPLDPSVNVHGIIIPKCFVLNSATKPMKIAFRCASRETDSSCDPRDQELSILFKAADDVRQDMFIMSVLSLSQYLLNKESFNLHLTPYPVLSTAHDVGLMAWVESMTLSAVMKKKGSIVSFFEIDANDHSSPALDIFLRSCAGYCVLTYLLGVGDRHSENLLLKKTGHFLHIDFGYIFGNDPKPYPPPFKLSPSMVEAMGGKDGPMFDTFQMYCVSAYNKLRSEASLILSITRCMKRSGLKDISKKQSNLFLVKVEEKLRLSLTDEEAGAIFLDLIHESATALISKVTDIFHEWAQYWRE